MNVWAYNVRGSLEWKATTDKEQAKKMAESPRFEVRPTREAEPAAPVDARDASALPSEYLLAKLAMVIPLFQEARDALAALREDQRVRHGISKTLAARMDVAGTFTQDDWRKQFPERAAIARQAAAPVEYRQVRFGPSSLRSTGSDLPPQDKT